MHFNLVVKQTSTKEMNQLSSFTGGLELGNLVVGSNLLCFSWAAISALQAELNQYQDQQSLSLRCRVYKRANYTIVALITSPSCTIHHLHQLGGDLVSSETLKENNFTLFEFLCSKGNPSFSIHRAAITLFYQYLSDLSQLKDQLVDSTTGQLLTDTPLIITGNSLGGSIASLFNLWLLESIDRSSTRRPLCVTFGSPLIGNLGLQGAILERPTWNSCFFNVAANQDPVPSLFVPSISPQPLASTPQTVLYRPFGPFLLCSESGCTCVDDPEVVSHLLEVMGLESRRSQVSAEYGALVENLKERFILRGSSLLGISGMDAGIFLQLEAIGDKRIQQQQHDMDIADLIKKLKHRERICVLTKRKGLNRSRKLNDIKIKMAYLEWYKKSCNTIPKKNKKSFKADLIGYYDSYRDLLQCHDKKVTMYKKFLTAYWEDMVEEAEKKPHKEGSFLLLTWLFAGTNYRRMVEPLDIAEYYRAGKRNYESQGRSKHYILLEKWAKEGAEKPASAPTNKKKQNVAGILTEDSCFWAKVEEALISSELLKDATSSVIDKQSSREYLINFEAYLMEQIKNYAVSPEIFLQKSTFMKWWSGFQEIASNALLIDFMKNCRYVQYEKGCF
ncbi:senescence-associated carboxylesterase 101 isoform X2 [Jatropha curcas]|uniref:senescence-associated carboxylesterase 101 isoform X2 n=1 Tax=Jatropha curcas TaxID=180498 RepID=UPI0005FB8E15|nr:senescence-associated carboxylesterase 101 isoform X2 [Jatropha curcas]